jgi:alpha-D-ribose 1-methylphosphonate 5-triphosphate diphosphatase
MSAQPMPSLQDTEHAVQHATQAPQHPPLYLTRARIVLADRTLEDASLLISNGTIEAVCPDSVPAAAREIDLSGQLLMPGLIDLHCDALEKEIEPRPRVHFPLEFACAQADRRNAAAGVTTIFHALSFANHELGVRNNAFAAEIARAMGVWQTHALVDNRVHVRYEVTDETAPPVLAELLAQGHAQMISFMDHSPGQGQFKDVAAFRSYLANSYKTSEDELDRIIDAKRVAAQGAMARMQSLAGLAVKHGVAIASHDDDTPEKVDVIAGLGAVISEFPINLETAKAAQARGLATLFGAPNVLRGKSQSGSMRALDAVLEGVADCLCGDYSPAALLPAMMKLPELAGIALHDAVRLVTRNPAQAAGMADRGEIAVGRRADLIAVQSLGGQPRVERVWVHGRPVLQVGHA